MKKVIATLLFCLISVFGWTADKTVTVKYSGGDYDSLDAAIAGELIANADLTSMAGILNIKIEGDWSSGADTAAVDIDGFTTSAAYYLNIYTDSANRATAEGYKTDRYRMEVANNVILRISDDHVRVDGLQLYQTSLSSNGKNVLAIAVISTPSDIRISNNRIRGSGSGSYYEGCIYINDPDATVAIWNNIIYGAGTVVANTYAATIYIDQSSTVNLYNNTIKDGYRGIVQNAGTVTAKNNAVFNTTIIDFLGTITADYNASDDDYGTNNVEESGGGADWPLDFKDAANGDFRLVAGSGLIDTALYNPGGGLYFDDIEGTNRGSSDWDVGAFEYSFISGQLAKSVANQMILKLIPGFEIIFALCIVSIIGNIILLFLLYRARNEIIRNKRYIQFFKDDDNVNALSEINKYLSGGD